MTARAHCVTAVLAATLAGSYLAPAVSNRQLLPGTVRTLAPGKILVSARGLPDSNFSETVVLLCDYNEKGAMGLVINRQSELKVAQAFPNLTLAREYAPTFFVGGPVEPSAVLALVRTSDARTDARHVLADVQLLSTRPELEALIARQTGTDRLRVFAGYSGWGPGQLDRETLTGSWHVFSSDSAIVFDPDPATLWERQVRRAQERFAFYPSLKTSTGSMREARHAGRNAATVPTAAMSATAPASVATSRGSSP